MNYRDLLSRLGALYDSGEARAVVRLLLEKRFALSWTDVLCGAVDGLSSEQTEELELLLCRLEAGEPVQYVLGEAEFYGSTFHVEQGALIPRPETEELVASVLSSISTEHEVKVLDIGTGSGCIAITLALELQQMLGDETPYSVVGWDISREALRIAQGNAEKLSAANIRFEEKDILSDSLSTDQREFSVTVSNPPYICNKERADIERQVLDYEPEEALFVPDEDPLLFYRAITLYAKKTLHPGGRLFFEINRAYGDATAELLRSHGFTSVTIRNDQFGNPRIVHGILF